jgi:ribosomal protein L7Ae-like RNA K-turn-binding protein
MDDRLGLVGLAYRAGKLAAGDAGVREAVTAKRVRLICTASDAGERVLAGARRMPERCNGLYTDTPFTRYELGAALGLKECGIIAFLDPGLAWAFAKKLTEIDDERYRALEADLCARRERAERRRAKKSNGGTRGNQARGG